MNPLKSQTARDILGDLLAIVHRDGGHRETEVGSHEAAKEAKLVFQLQRVTIKALSDRLDRLVKACGIGSMPVCHECGKPATCLGTYEGNAHEFACDQCCGHGYEDGFCVRVEEFEP